MFDVPVDAPSGWPTAGHITASGVEQKSGTNCGTTSMLPGTISAPIYIYPPPNATITAPIAATEGAEGLIASVPLGTGPDETQYIWSISNGYITAPAGNQVTYQVGSAGTTTLTCKVINRADRGLVGTFTTKVYPAPKAPITVPNLLEAAGTTGCTASVPVQDGATYTWTITGGTITSGSGTNAIKYTVTASAGGKVLLTCSVKDAPAVNTVVGTQSVSVGAAPLAIRFVTINQGVERYLNSVDQTQGTFNSSSYPSSTWKLQTWKSGVPLIAGRPARFTVHLLRQGATAIQFGTAATAKNKLTLVLNNGGTETPIAMKATTFTVPTAITYFGETSNTLVAQFDVTDPAVLTPTTQLQVNVTLDPALRIDPQFGVINPYSTYTNPVPLGLKNAPPMTVNLVRVKYIYVDGGTRKVEWVGKANSQDFTDAVTAAQNYIKSYYPTATGPIIVAPQNDLFFVCSEDYRDETGVLITVPGSGTYSDGTLASFNLTQNGAWDGVRGFVPEWVPLKPSLGITEAHPANTFVAVLVPRITGHTCLASGAYVTGIGTADDHFIIFLHQAGEVIAHELGHAHGRHHVQWPLSGTMMAPGPWDAPPTVSPGYPYSNGTIGVGGWDPLSGNTKVKDANTDIMSYGTLRWISDYNFYNFWKYDYDMWPSTTK